MDKHSAFMEKLVMDGTVLATGPVQDPSGTFGFAIIFAETEDKARGLLQNDPAQQIATYSFFPLLATFNEK
ncbi:MAG: YciI family protein [Eubacteriaceae bacterium]|nr:YciI family protein [Eubacteriaceae bacterium]